MQIRNMQSLNSGSSSKRSPLLIQQPSGRTPQRKKVTFKIPNKGPSDSIADSFDEFKPTDEAFAPEVGNGKNIPSYRKPSSRPSGLGIGSNGNIFFKEILYLHLGRLLL